MLYRGKETKIKERKEGRKKVVYIKWERNLNKINKLRRQTETNMQWDEDWKGRKKERKKEEDRQRQICSGNKSKIIYIYIYIYNYK